MTPLHLQLMLHYYAIAEPFDNESDTAHEYRDDLVSLALIEIDERSGSGYRATEKGCAFVELLRSTPMPIQIWRDPRFEPNK